MGKNQTRKCDIVERIEKAYTGGEAVFIDESVVRRVRRKTIRMQGQITLRIIGKIYQKCLEELGLWRC
jgi:hypothetical protein